jgi:uncharacterized protein (DUF849 family)
MELTQTYKNKVTKAGSETSFQKSLLTFINRHADVFKALARVGAPYGESVRRQTTGSGISNVMPEEQIDVLQLQLNELSQTIESLRVQLNTRSKAAQTDYKQSGTIGINRFRAIPTEY